jgi:hypothetical protein
MNGYHEMPEDLFRALAATLTHAGGKETKVDLGQDIVARIFYTPEIRADLLTTGRGNGRKRFWFKFRRPNDGEK